MSRVRNHCDGSGQVIDSGLRSTSAAWRASVEEDILPIDVVADAAPECVQWYGPLQCKYDLDIGHRGRAESLGARLMECATCQGDRPDLLIIHLTPHGSADACGSGSHGPQTFVVICALSGDTKELCLARCIGSPGSAIVPGSQLTITNELVYLGDLIVSLTKDPETWDLHLVKYRPLGSPLQVEVEQVTVFEGKLVAAHQPKENHVDAVAFARKVLADGPVRKQQRRGGKGKKAVACPKDDDVDAADNVGSPASIDSGDDDDYEQDWHDLCADGEGADIPILGPDASGIVPRKTKSSAW
jgi:hypothetical protein